MKIPYVQQPDSNSCALASNAMVAKYFFSESTLEEVARNSNWDPGYIFWSFQFWLWMMDKGIKIEDYDTIDYSKWAEEGIEGLKKSVPAKEFDFYLQGTKNLNSYGGLIYKVLSHKNFIYHKQKPKFEDLSDAFEAGKVCEVVVDARALRAKEGFSLHRVVIVKIENNTITLHDPSLNYGPDQKIDLDIFKKSWLEAVLEPELCIYAKD